MFQEKGNGSECVVFRCAVWGNSAKVVDFLQLKGDKTATCWCLAVNMECSLSFSDGP